MSLYDYLYFVLFPVLVLSIFIISIRFIKGPSIQDRIVALDLILTVGIGIISIYSIITKQYTFLDIALLFALIAFLGTIAFSYYLVKRKSNE